MNPPSYVEDNLPVLKKLKHFDFQKRDFLILSGGKELTLAFCELLTNLVKHSNKTNLHDKKVIKSISDSYNDLAQIMNIRTSLKIKKHILINNKILQRLAISVALDGYLYFKEHHDSSKWKIETPSELWLKIETQVAQNHNFVVDGWEGDI